MLQAGGRGEIWKVDGCLLVLESTQIMGARPHKWVRALILREHPKIMGARPHLVGGLVISSFSSLQLRVDVSKIRSR